MQSSYAYRTLSFPADLMDHVMINCRTHTPDTSTKTCRPLPKILRSAASEALWSGNLQGCGSLFSKVQAPVKISQPHPACARRGSVKYRCYMLPFQMNSNKLKMSVLKDWLPRRVFIKRGWGRLGGGGSVECGMTAAFEAKPLMLLG